MTDDNINQHKRMAMGGSPDSGDFGVTQVESLSRGRTAKAGRPRKSHLRDHERGAGQPVPRGEGYHPAQRNPDHGPTDYDA